MTAAARERLRVRVPVLVMSGAAWVMLALAPETLFPHAHDGAMPPGSSWSAGWAVMLAAMMLPLLTAPLRHVRDRSFARRRTRGAALFLFGYATPWMVAGGVLAGASVGLSALGVPPLIVLAAALAWHCSPARQHAVNRGHTHPPLVSSGLGADGAVLRFGVVHGSWCVASCGAVMIAVAYTPAWHLAAMAAATAWLVAERIDGPEQPRWRIPVPARAARAAAAYPAWLARRWSPAVVTTFQA